jgi:hypothetical protein
MPDLSERLALSLLRDGHAVRIGEPSNPAQPAAPAPKKKGRK